MYLFPPLKKNIISVPWSVGLERLDLVGLWGWHNYYSVPLEDATMGSCKERALPGLKVMCCVMCEARTQGRAAANISWQITEQKKKKLVSCSAVSEMLLEGTGRAGLSHSSILIEVLHCRQKSDVVSKQLRPTKAHFKIYWNKTGLLSNTGFF